MMNQIIFRLFTKPTMIIISSPLLYLTMLLWIPSTFRSGTHLSFIGKFAKENAGAPSLLVLSIGCSMLLINMYRFRQWLNGESPRASALELNNRFIIATPKKLVNLQRLITTPCKPSRNPVYSRLLCAAKDDERNGFDGDVERCGRPAPTKQWHAA